MNWIKVSDQMPENVPGEAFTETVFVWIIEDWDEPENGHGYADSGIHSDTWGGWIVEEGTLESRGYKVTHWAKIEPPKFDSSPSAA